MATINSSNINITDLDFDNVSNSLKEYLKGQSTLKDYDFDYLWKYLWGDVVAQQYRSEEKLSREKLNILKDGITNNNDFFNLNSLINECSEIYLEPEWGFPKGRRNFQEKDITCGIREFEEETGYLKNDIVFLENIIPFEEIYTGTNLKSYKHKYFLAYIENIKTPSNNFQATEIRDLQWVNINNCEKYIREYSIEKIYIINKLKNILNNYQIYR